MGYLPSVYKRFLKDYPDVSKAHDELAGLCHEGGPLDARTRRLVKLGIAIGQVSEGAVKSHARRALEEGMSPDEVRHAVLLSLTTAGFPALIAAFGWVNEVLDARS